jgi:hypothetical protein
LAVGRAVHAETGELVTLYSSSTGIITNDRIERFLDLAAGEKAVNVNLVEYKDDGFGIINNIHQSHAELNMIYWAQKEGYILEGIGVSHNAGVCPHCYAQMMQRGISTSNQLFKGFNSEKIPAVPPPQPKWWR